MKRRSRFLRAAAGPTAVGCTRSPPAGKGSSASRTCTCVHAGARLFLVSHLQGAFLCTGVQLEVVNAHGRDDVPFPPGVTGAVGEDHLVVAFTRPQQTQVLTKE